jgi:hypothetical protein
VKIEEKMLLRRRNLVAGAVIGASVASNRAATRQQEQMYQQQTQQQIAIAQADAASAQREAQELKLQQQQQQTQQPQPVYAQPQQPQPIYVQPQQPQPVYVASEPVPVPQQVVYQIPPAKQAAHSQTALPPPPPAIQPQQPLLELFAPHIVDEESPAIKPHNIISVPEGGRVRLVAGSLTEGLPTPYGDYIQVNYNGKIGKISRLVVRQVEG